MKTCLLLGAIALACALPSPGACSQSAGRGAPTNSAAAAGASTNGADWIANGADACEKFLTPDVVAAILRTPVGKPERLDADSCRAGGIHISLKVADIDAYRLELPRIVGTHPMDGVGDGAYWNQAGAVSAVKGHDRGCDISVIGAPTKVQGAALGQKLGEICNKLFALP